MLSNQVRYHGSPGAKTSDSRGAFCHVAALPEVDDARLNSLGLGASAGHMAGTGLATTQWTGLA
ncbi:MAG: hypothetical protein AAFY65_19975 [Pseudomonadota bacterium]